MKKKIKVKKTVIKKTKKKSSVKTSAKLSSKKVKNKVKSKVKTTNTKKNNKKIKVAKVKLKKIKPKSSFKIKVIKRKPIKVSRVKTSDKSAKKSTPPRKRKVVRKFLKDKVITKISNVGNDISLPVNKSKKEQFDIIIKEEITSLKVINLEVSDKPVKSFKSLGELKFDSIGDEYLFLFETLTKFNIELHSNKPSIEELRIVYRELVSSEGVEDKYNKTSVYWSDAQENAVVLFQKEQDKQNRDAIFNKYLNKPLKKLIENIIFTYKLYRNDIGISEQQTDCVSFLITKIEKYDHKTGAKAFAYLGTIAKHYLMNCKKVSHKIHKNNVDIDEPMNANEASSRSENTYNIEDGIPKIDMQSKIFDAIIKEIEVEIQRPDFSMNDKAVGEAIVWVFKNHEMLQVYNKNLIYHLLKERTGFDTKEITASLSRLKSFYRLFKDKFFQQHMEE